ncbi:AMP-binding protein [Xanthobacter sp. V4C-4]|uniref:AMP-binding protein n=1 Tax=Xanthobacter cornucopiae TaxID=3119924 RepID=UPI00372C39BB
MRTFFEKVADLARRAPDRRVFSDADGTLTRAGLMGDAARLVAALPAAARVIGLLLPNGRAWAVAQIACVASGRIAVPLPAFFSPAQIAHIVRDAGIELVLVPPGGHGAAPQGLARHPVAVTGASGPAPAFQDGYGTLIYTSGSTGTPKGVRHDSGQVGWSAAALAAAIGAGPTDSYLSVLPLSLLLESICAVFVPALVGGHAHFATGLAEAVGRGAAAGIAAAFDTHQPTVSVVVPELLRVWLGELSGGGRRAPQSLRFVAAGGAPVPPRLAAAAWRAGIPVHEGYGLSECGSVVALNRPGARAAGTVGLPLPGLSVSIRDGEILVDGPSVTDGYAGRPGAARPWPTGDLGGFDAAGRLFVSGRKDNLIVTALGRNVSPEWVETAILDDPGITACAVGADQGWLVALVVPAPAALAGFRDADPQARAHRIASLCANLPPHARPQHVVVVDLATAGACGLFTDNGRIRRAVAATLIARAAPVPVPFPSPDQMEPAKP